MSNLPALVSSLAGSAVVAFVVAVAIDNFVGVVAAVKAKSFDTHKLPSFLASQFGTKEALALGGLIVTAYVSGGDVRQAAMATLTAGGGAMTLSVLADAYGKVKAMLTPAAPAAK